MLPFNLGFPELIVIAFLAILFFGKDKLSDLAKGTADAIKEFRGAFGSEDATQSDKKSKSTVEKTKGE